LATARVAPLNKPPSLLTAEAHAKQINTVTGVTMSVSEEAIKEFQELYEKKYGERLTWPEASEAANNLVNLFELLFDWDRKERCRQLRLKDAPDGFHLTDDTYTCAICSANVTGDASWYDKYGIKCMNCQRAVEKRIVPGSICENRDSWYSMWELGYYYNVKSSTIHRLIREKKLKVRIVPTEDGKPHCYVFLIKDNPEVLKPKPKAIREQRENGYISISHPKLTLGTGM